MYSGLKDAQTKQKGMTNTDGAARKKLGVGLLTLAGNRLSDTGAKLKALPAPTFPGGGAFATKTVTVFTKAGPALTAAAKKLAATLPTTTNLAAANLELVTQLKGVAGQITAVGSLDVPDTTKRQLLQVPACTKLQSTVQG